MSMGMGECRRQSVDCHPSRPSLPCRGLAMPWLLPLSGLAMLCRDSIRTVRDRASSGPCGCPSRRGGMSESLLDTLPHRATGQCAGPGSGPCHGLVSKTPLGRRSSRPASSASTTPPPASSSPARPGRRRRRRGCFSRGSREACSCGPCSEADAHAPRQGNCDAAAPRAAKAAGL